MLRPFLLSMWRRTSRLFLSLMFILGACVSSDRDDAHDRLFTHVNDAVALTDAQGSLLSEWRQRPGVLRAELVRLNYSLRERGKVGDRIVFNPFSDVAIELRFREAENGSGSEYLWRGGDRTVTTTAVFAVRGLSVYGTVHYQNRVFQIVPLGNDQHLAVEMDRQDLKLY